MLGFENLSGFLYVTILLLQAYHQIQSSGIMWIDQNWDGTSDGEFLWICRPPLIRKHFPRLWLLPLSQQQIDLLGERPLWRGFYPRDSGLDACSRFPEFSCFLEKRNNPPSHKSPQKQNSQDPQGASKKHPDEEIQDDHEIASF